MDRFDGDCARADVVAQPQDPHALAASHRRRVEAQSGQDLAASAVLHAFASPAPMRADGDAEP